LSVTSRPVIVRRSYSTYWLLLLLLVLLLLLLLLLAAVLAAAACCRRLYLAYTVFWAIGGLLAMQVCMTVKPC
jgi:hypothetical protein